MNIEEQRLLTDFNPLYNLFGNLLIDLLIDYLQILFQQFQPVLSV